MVWKNFIVTIVKCFTMKKEFAKSAERQQGKRLLLKCSDRKKTFQIAIGKDLVMNKVMKYFII
ncbi:hypothetical protein ACUXHY_004453 [Cytobacillus horneckiae]|uniref:hypothetical protein n=1 Tax=Cytobacillus horneckiae TaxID=549687 RepID=UPI0019D19B36|nr:hypothetical protein [Cytobacillus horneckiae]